MRAGPRLSSEAQHIDTFVSFIQRCASHHRIKSLSRWDEAKLELNAYILFYMSINAIDGREI